LNTKNKFGIIQGRLTESKELQCFPESNWENEFFEASNIGFSFIELLTERKFNKNNPVWNKSGQALIKTLSKENNLEIYSLCTDYIIDNNVLDSKSSHSLKHIEKFLDSAIELDCSVLIFPFLEESNITKSNMLDFVPLIRDMADHLNGTEIIIVIESLLEAKDLRNLLEKINLDNIKCVFDTGNRINLTNNLSSEINILGDLIHHVHIKDKDKEGNNVILGTGMVNFNDAFKSFNKIDYKGPYVFETTRGKDPLITGKFHMDFCNFFISETK
tara:strand:+ start:5797 stop:6615 length:819 start_codon:yes stop_codon:yes gene_type:complete